METTPIGASPFRLWMTALALPAVLTIAIYGQVFPSLVAEWAESPTFSHGFAIPFIAAYLIWARRRQLRDVQPAPAVAGLPVLVAGLAALVLGVRGEEPFLARISLPVTLFGIALFLGGGRFTRFVWPGLAYLVFMIPLPWTTVKSISYRSRMLDATVAAHALQWLGVPLFQDGFYLHLPNIVLEVADACSSIPAIAALLALGVAYASLADRPVVLRAFLILATLPMAIAANIVRIVTVAWAAYYVGPWTLRTAYHMFNGTVNFMLTFLLLLALDTLLAAIARRWIRASA